MNSRFGRALIAFDVGRELLEDVDTERANLAGLEGVLMDLEAADEAAKELP